jgi:hypothetical protein
MKSLDVSLDKSHNIGHQSLSCVDGEIVDAKSAPRAKHTASRTKLA